MNYTEINYPQNGKTLKKDDIITFNYSGTYKEITLYPGDYKMECWGAKGGYCISGLGGLGGYTSGVIKIKSIRKFYIYVGDTGGEIQNSFNYGGWNGGGNSGPGGWSVAGGGASDIRVDNNRLIDRIIVAGAGGGGMGNGTAVNPGAVGGGLTGGIGHTTTAATQTNGGTSSNGNGSFGKGGDHTADGSGGGGGYYGGAAANGDAQGGGGSSFISGLSGCNAVDENGIHTNQPNHFSNLIFSESLTQSGIRNSSGLIKITVIRRTGYFINDNTLKYRENNIIYDTSKTTDNITMDYFYNHSMNDEEWGGGGQPLELIFASIEKEISYQFIPLAQIIVNKNPIVLKNNISIHNITISDNKKFDYIKYIIYNGYTWMTYKNNQWNEISLNIDDILVNGMISEEIKTFNKFIWNDLFVKDKLINFAAVLDTSIYNSECNISKINILYSLHKKKKVKDNLYIIEEDYKEIAIEWITGNKEKIEIVHSN